MNHPNPRSPFPSGHLGAPCPWRGLALAAALAVSLGAAHAQAAVFRTVASGDWFDPGVWRVEGRDADGLPDRDDEVWITQGHALTYRLAHPEPVAAHLHIRGRLVLPDDGRYRLEAWRISAEGGGELVARGPHRLVLTGDPALDYAFLGALRGGLVDLQGRVEVEEGTLTGVVSERRTRLVVEDASARFTPGALAGHQLKLLDGRGRLRTFAVIDNTATTLTLDLTRLGDQRSEPELRPQLDAADRRVLVLPPETIDIQPASHLHRRWRGRWLRREDPREGARFHYVIGAIDGQDAAPDRVVVWPPLPPGDPGALALTWGLAAGDRYTLAAPLEITIPEPFHLPADSRLRTFRVYAGDGSRTRLRHVEVGYSHFQIQGIDQDNPDEGFEVEHVTLHNNNSSCAFSAQDVAHLDLAHLTIRDVHPRNETEAYGGDWDRSVQRGHGVCLRGHDLILRDSLLHNLNDDMVYVARSRDVTVTGNLLINTGVFHGNSFENITLYQPEGDLTVTGNVTHNAHTSMLVSQRPAGVTITVRDNVFVQADWERLYEDEGGPDDGPVLFENNVALAVALERPVRADFHGARTLVRDSALYDLTLYDPPEVTGAVLRSLGPRHDPLVVNGGALRSNVLAASPTFTGALARFVSDSALMDAAFEGNTLDPGLGAAMVLELAGGCPPSLRWRRNISTGVTFRAQAGAPPGCLDATHNLSTGAPWSDPEGIVASLLDDTNRVAPVAWRDPTRYTLPDGSIAIDGGPDGARLGYSRAGLRDPDALPLPLDGLDARLESRPDTTPDDPCGGDPRCGVPPQIAEGNGQGTLRTHPGAYDCATPAQRPARLPWGWPALLAVLMARAIARRKITHNPLS